MTQFQSIAANTLSAINQSPLQTKKKQTQDRLANPANRTSLRDRRNLALINQGIDPDELRRETRLKRFAFKRDMMQNREMFREAKRTNDPALRRQAEQERLRLEGERLNINDRFKLTRSSNRDLPADEQVKRRAESRAQLQAQLPTIAASARAQETQAATENTARLARIGREAYKLELGTTPPQNMSDEAMAEFARSASPEVVDQVTRGVGLPQAPQTGNADRLARLAQTGVDFPDFAPSARQDNPTVVNRIRTGQAQDRLDRQAQLAIAGNRREGAVVGSTVAGDDARTQLARNENERERLRVDGAAQDARNDLQLRQGEADIRKSEAEVAQLEAQTEVVKLQFEQARRQAEENLLLEGIDMDVNVATGAIAQITNSIGETLSSEDFDSIDEAVSNLNTMLSQYDGVALRHVASNLLNIFNNSGVDYGKIDFDSQSFLGARSFKDSTRANNTEAAIQSLVSTLRLYATGIGNVAPNITPAQPGEGRLAEDGTRRFNRVVRVGN